MYIYNRVLECKFENDKFHRFIVSLKMTKKYFSVVHLDTLITAEQTL